MNVRIWEYTNLTFAYLYTLLLYQLIQVSHWGITKHSMSKLGQTSIVVTIKCGFGE